MNTLQARVAAKEMREKAAEVLRVAQYLDVRADICNCCSAARYKNWPQKQLHDQMIGAAERLNTIAATLERRADDPRFLGHTTMETQDDDQK